MHARTATLTGIVKATNRYSCHVTLQVAGFVFFGNDTWQGNPSWEFPLSPTQLGVVNVAYDVDGYGQLVLDLVSVADALRPALDLEDLSEARFFDDGGKRTSSVHRE